MSISCPYRTTRYAYFECLDASTISLFSIKCIDLPDAYRGHARAFLKDLEAARPSAIIDIIYSGEAFELKEEVKKTQKAQHKETCERCGYMSSNPLCKACTLLEGLERVIADAGITDQGRKRLDAQGPTPDNFRKIPLSFFKAPSDNTSSR